MFNQFNVENKWYTFTDKIMSVSGELFVDNNVDISGNLSVNCNASINNLNVNEIITTSSIQSGILYVNGDASINNLNVNEIITTSSIQSGILDVNGDASINNLNVNEIITTSSIQSDNSIAYPNTFTIRSGTWGARVELEEHNIKYYGNAHYFSNRGGVNFASGSDYGIILSGSSSSAGPYYTSDDRLKHNESNVIDALDAIRQLQLQTYQKTRILKDADFNGILDEPYEIETGFIAQEVEKIPQLNKFVAKMQNFDSSDNTQEIYYLTYNGIFLYNVAATKELDNIVQAQQNEINELKSKLNELLSEAGKETI
jgi:hypothetical protein